MTHRSNRRRLLSAHGAALLLMLCACSQQKSAEEHLSAAQRHIQAGDHSAAQIELRNVIQVAPTNGQAQRLLGVTWLRLGDPAAAEVALRKALTLSEKADDVFPGLALALLRQSQPQKVIDEFAGANLQDPAAHAALRATVGQAWLMRGEVTPAAEAFAAALGAQPGHAEALLGMARIAASEGKLDDALGMTEAALKNDGRLADAYITKSQILMAKGQREPAIETLEKALAANPGHLPTRLGLASILVDAKDYEKAKAVLGAAGAASGDPRVQFLQAVVALRQGDLPMANDRVAAVLKSTPENGAALALAGEIELRSRNLAMAELRLGQAMRHQPTPTVRRLLAFTYLRQNRPAKAVDILQPLLQGSGPRDAALAMLAGEAYLANGDFRRAADYFDAAKSAGGNEGDVRTRLGQLAVAQGDFERGLQELQAASAANPQTVEPDLLLVTVHLQRHEPDKALAAARAFIAKQPNSPLGHTLAGTAQTLKGDSAGARQSFEAALKIKPDHVPALRGLTGLDVAEGKQADAQQRYEALLVSRPNDEQLLVALAALQEQTGRADLAAKTLQRAIAASPTARDPVVALVQHHARRNERAAALAIAQQAVHRNPDDANLVMLLGATQEAAGARTEALRTLTTLVAREQYAAAPSITLAQLQVRQRDFEGAVRTLQHAQTKAPQNDAVTRELVGVLVQRGKVDQALNLAKEVQVRRPDAAAGYELEGDIRAHAKKWADAERAYRTALKIDPSAGAAAAKVYRSLLAAGKKKAAEDFAAEWIARHRFDATMRVLMADAALQARDYPAAIKLYEEVLGMNANQPMVLNNLAWALGQIKDPKAMVTAQRAAALAPNSADVLDTLGMLHLQAGDAKRGLEVLDRARQMQPERLDLRLHRAQALLSNGRKEEGRAELRELAAAEADFPGKADIPTLLATP